MNLRNRFKRLFKNIAGIFYKTFVKREYDKKDKLTKAFEAFYKNKEKKTIDDIERGLNKYNENIKKSIKAEEKTISKIEKNLNKHAESEKLKEFNKVEKRIEQETKKKVGTEVKDIANSSALLDINKLKNELMLVANEGGTYVHEFRESYFVIEDIIDKAVSKHRGNTQQIFDILANWSVDWYDELVRLIQAYASDSEYNTSTGGGDPTDGQRKYLAKCRSLAKALGVQFVEARVTFI